MKITKFVIIFIVLLSFVVGIYFYNQFPDKVASHWGINGEINGYMSKFWGLFLMPIIGLIMFLMFIIIPKIDPLKENINKFRKYFDWFIIIIMLFLFYLYLLTIFWNLGKEFNMVRALIPAFAILFYYAGVLIGHAKKNWFIGVRTPWTMHSDAVWDKTHKLGSRLFKISAIISLFGLIIPSIAFWLVIIPIILFSLYLVVYSYFEYKKETVQ